MKPTDPQFVQKLLYEVESISSEFLHTDRVRLLNLIRRIRTRINQNKPIDQIVNKLNLVYSKAQLQRQEYQSYDIHLSYPSHLPISSHVSEIKRVLEESQVLIVCGETASGKTSQLPKILLEAGYGRKGRIGVTQPRRLAATSMAHRVAIELGCQLGGPVGYQIRFENQTSNQTIIKFMTDGILLAETLADKYLYQYDTIIVDEAHERSLNIDFILGYLKTLLPKRPDLKLLISSATLDTEAFRQFFNQAPVVKVKGKTFPVEEVFLPPSDSDRDLSLQVFDAVQWVVDLDEKGDILVFLPGEREIKEALDVLKGKKLRGIDILPLYARLSVKEQQRAFKKCNTRRIILSTNVAETSLTIPNIKYVVDSGLSRLSRYQPSLHLQVLQVEQVSQASARQRQGRCGRTEQGVCVRLYSQEILEKTPQHTDPEILRSSLAGVILHMKTIKLPAIERFPFIDPPKYTSIREGYRSLWQIKALDRQRQLTDIGNQIAVFPLDPHLSRMVHQGRQERVLPEILVITTFLSIQDPRERPLQNQEKADKTHQGWNHERSDFISIINLWNYLVNEKEGVRAHHHLRKICNQNFLNYRRIREWFNLYNDLLELVRSLKWKVPTGRVVLPTNEYDKIHTSLLAGCPAQIGLSDGRGGYKGIKEQKFYIHPGSGLFRTSPKWIMAASLVETSKRYARLAAEIDPRYLEKVADHLCTFYYRDIHFDSNSGFVTAKKTFTFLDILTNRETKIHYDSVDREDARNIFIRDGIVPADLNSRHEWLPKYRRLLQYIAEMEKRMRRPDYLLNTEAIFDHFDRLLPATVASTQSLDKWLDKSKRDLTIPIEDAISLKSIADCERDFPGFLSFYGHKFQLSYTNAPGKPTDGICLICPISLIWLLPEWALDWVVPGWLQEKVRLLIRSLPKSLRACVIPVDKTAELFLEATEQGIVERKQPLLKALAEYLSQASKEKITSDDFSPDRLPEHLTMKVMLREKNGKTIQITSSIPDRSDYSSQIPAIFPLAKQWCSQGNDSWPQESLPESVILDQANGLHGFIALIDEKDSVGCGVFIDKTESERMHKAGIIRLFHIHNSELIKGLRRNEQWFIRVVENLGTLNPSEDQLTNIVDSAIWDTLTDNGSISIRSQQCYQHRIEATQGKLLTLLEKRLKLFTTIIEKRQMILTALERVWGGKESIRDIENQINYLFRPGFLQSEYMWEDYPRYLKALDIRLQRLNYSSDKDRNKLSELLHFQNLLDRKIESEKGLQRSPQLQDYARLLQEYRIALFAPEIPTRQKVSKKLLECFWDQ